MTKESRTKIKKPYLLSTDTVEKIELLSKEKKLTYGGTIELIVDAYFESRTEKHKVLMESLDVLLEKKFDDKLAGVLEGLNRVRVASNVIDRNVQMELEFWNHYFVVNNAKALGSTEKHKTIQLSEAEELVKNRIRHNRQKKIDWENKRMKSIRRGLTNG